MAYKLEEIKSLECLTLMIPYPFYASIACKLYPSRINKILTTNTMMFIQPYIHLLFTSTQLKSLFSYMER